MSGGVWKRFTRLSLGGAVLGITLCAAAAPPAKKAPAARKPAVAAKPAPSGAVFLDNTPLTQEQKIVHTLNRLGFGPRPGDVERVRAMGLDTYIARQLTPEKIGDAAVEAKLAPFMLLAASSEDLHGQYLEWRKQVAQLQKARAQQADAAMKSDAASPGESPAKRPVVPQRGRNVSQMSGTQLQMAKITRAVESERQLQEVLVDFWTNHFNIDVRKGNRAYFKVVDDREVVRQHALGRFRDLLGASAKSPAMLFYLDNAQSSAPQPVNPRLARRLRQQGGLAAQAAPKPGQKTRGGINENYAREIMELHTLGVEGGYTQKDVQEVARCLTGWSVNPRTGEFQFYPNRHDDGEKIVLGQRIPAGGGIRDGEKVLDILASRPATATYVSRKLCQRFVSDEPPAALVNRCAQVWARTDGDLRAVIRAIVTSPEFFSRAAYRQKIKSPFEYVVSSVRALGGTVELEPRAALRNAGFRPAAQGRPAAFLPGQIATMQQPLFQHQAPTGYPEDSRKWVSAGALIQRINFALSLAGNKVLGVDLGETTLLTGDASDPASLVNQVADHLLHGDISPATRATLLKQVRAQPDAASAASEVNLPRRVAALVLGSPEFQRR